MFDLILIFCSCVLLFYYLDNKTKRRKYKTPPGPKTYPIIGCTLDFLKLKTGSDFFKLVDEYMIPHNYVAYSSALCVGKVCGIARPEHMQVVLNCKGSLNKPKLIYTRIKFIGDSMLAHPAELWRQRRKLFAPAFYAPSINRYFNKWSHLTYNRFCKMLEEKYADKDYFYVKNDFGLHFLLGTMETMANLDTAKMDKAPIMEAIHAVDRLVERVSGSMVELALNMVKDLYFGKTETTEDRILRLFAAWVLDTYEEQKRDNPEEEESNEFSLGIDSLKTLPREEMLKELQAVMVAAYDTISTTFAYFAVILAMHPHIQDKIYEEMKTIFGDSDRQATEEDVRQMVYLESCTKESMRLYSAGPFVLRETTEDVKLDDEYTIPAGTTVFILIYLLHRNPSVWKNPDVFNPENFSPENWRKMNPYNFVAFSGGPRNCLGYKLAMSTMKLTMSAIIRKYHLETDMNMSDLKNDRIFSLRSSHVRLRLKTRSR